MYEGLREIEGNRNLIYLYKSLSNIFQSMFETYLRNRSVAAVKVKKFVYFRWSSIQTLR